ncbi:hypothetical protein ABZP36_000505 [Zizania latifolia]
MDGSGRSGPYDLEAGGRGRLGLRHIINWMQNRLNAKQEKRRTDAAAAAAVSSARCRGESCRQEAREEKVAIADYGFLSIGTLGNESPPRTMAPLAAAEQDVPDFTVEEVKKLQEALNKLLRRAKSKSSGRGSTADQLPLAAAVAAGDDERAGSNLPLDRFLNCPSSLEVDRTISLGRHAAEVDGGQNGELSPDTHILLSKARDLLVTTTTTNNNGDIKQKSFKFLLKKMFICRGGFATAPSLKDPVESRTEKLFRTMLHRKMNPRPNNAPRGKIMQREHIHDEEDEDGEDIFKWDKTDSDLVSYNGSLEFKH